MSNLSNIEGNVPVDAPKRIPNGRWFHMDQSDPKILHASQMWPWKVAKGLPESVSQSRAVWSAEAVSTRRTSGSSSRL
jgi:hypothetical protein